MRPAQQTAARGHWTIVVPKMLAEIRDAAFHSSHVQNRIATGGRVGYRRPGAEPSKAAFPAWQAESQAGPLNPAESLSSSGPPDCEPPDARAARKGFSQQRQSEPLHPLPLSEDA